MLQGGGVQFITYVPEHIATAGTPRLRPVGHKVRPAGHIQLSTSCHMASCDHLEEVQRHSYNHHNGLPTEVTERSIFKVQLKLILPWLPPLLVRAGPRISAPECEVDMDELEQRKLIDSELLLALLA